MLRCHLPDLAFVLEEQRGHRFETQLLVAQTEDRNTGLTVRCLASDRGVLCQSAVNMAAGPFDPIGVADTLGVIWKDILNQYDIPPVMTQNAGSGLAQGSIYRESGSVLIYAVPSEDVLGG